MSRHLKGTILVSAAAFFWGIGGTAAKIMFNTAITPIELATMRMSSASAVLFIYMAITQRQLLVVTKKDFMQIAILGVVGIAFMQTTYYHAVARLNVSLGIFLQYLSPVLITIYCVFVYKDKLTKEKAIALTFAMIGSYYIIFGGGPMGVKLNVDGVAAGFASAGLSAFYAIYGKKCAAKFHPWTILAYGLGAGAILYSFICPPWILWANRSSYELLFIMYIVTFGTIVPYGLYLVGVKYLVPTTAGIISMAETVIASLSAYIILGEYMSPKQLMGAGFIIFAILILQVGGSILKKIKIRKGSYGETIE